MITPRRKILLCVCIYKAIASRINQGTLAYGVDHRFHQVDQGSPWHEEPSTHLYNRLIHELPQLAGAASRFNARPMI